MVKHGRAFLDFYDERNIIPVRQDIRDLDVHFRRRTGLYRQLGLVPSWIHGKDVIEFGPGTGDNAVFTASLRPRAYVLVDANPSSLDAIGERIAQGFIKGALVEVVESDILAYPRSIEYDLVLCEGVIPSQTDPRAFARHVADFVKPGGVLVITTVSATSHFPETCRRALKPFFANRYADFDGLRDGLVEFFREDLDSLRFTSRMYEDWVLETVLQQFRAQPFFTIPEAIDTLGDAFDVLGFSPGFFTDGRWYKTIVGEDSGVNAMARTQYLAKGITFLDGRVEAESVGMCDGGTVERLCRQAFHVAEEMWEADDEAMLPGFLDLVSRVSSTIAGAMPGTARSLDDFVKGAAALAGGDFKADFGTFRTLFGHSQQYVSLIRS